jgi:hypothetical protein
MQRAFRKSTRVFAIARIVRRLTFLIAVLFLGCAPSSPEPFLEVERHELTEASGDEEAAWALLEVRSRDGLGTRVAVSAMPQLLSPRELFALYRKWPPPSPVARGPDAPSPPIPHLLN